MHTSPIPLHVLLLEDVPDDALLIEHELEAAGYAVRAEVVDTREEFLARLRPGIDVILCDHALPQFNAFQALDLVQQRGLDVPFIIVSGAIQEETAVEAMRRGAADYLLKDRLARLGPAVEQALRERQHRLEKERAFEAIRQSEALNRSVLASLSAHIAVLDRTGCIVSVNEAWEAFAIKNGGPLRERVGACVNYLDVCRKAADEGAPLAAEALAGIQAVLEGTRLHFTLEYACHGPGRRCWFLMRVTPLAGPSGGAVVAHEEVTDRRQAEERVRASEARYRFLAEHATDVIVRIGPSGTLLYVSPSSAARLGYAPDELVGRDAFALVHPDDAAGLRGGLDAGDRLPRASVTYRVRHRDGAYVWIEANGTIVRDRETGAVREVVAVLRDVTERVRAEQELRSAKEAAEEASRLKGAILANMSHEFRTPLTGILGFTSVLAEEVADPQHREFVALIESSGQRLLGTFNALIALAEFEAGRQEVPRHPIDLRAPLKRAVERYTAEAAARGLALTATYPDTPVVAIGDERAFEQVAATLISNAIKFTEEGRVRIAVRSGAAGGELVVSDTGVGIGEAFLPYVFTEFRQESEGHARSFEGTGLGLAIAKRLVEMMGGAVEVESEKGAGTTFTVRLRGAPDPGPAGGAPLLA